MSVKEKIFEILEQYEEHGLYREIEVNGEWKELEVGDEIAEVLSKHRDIDRVWYDAEEMIENPGISIYSVSIVWKYKSGEVDMILNYEIDYI